MLRREAFKDSILKVITLICKFFSTDGLKKFSLLAGQASYIIYIIPLILTVIYK